MITTQYINLNMTPSGVLPVLYCSQYDIGRPMGMVVYNGSEAVDLDTYTCTIEATRTDGTAIIAAVTTDDNIGAFVTTATMTNQADKYPAKLVLFDSNSRRVASLAFVMCVTAATMDENAESIEEDASLYQQYTGTVQALIAEIREDISDLNDKVDRRTAYCYKDFGAKGDGVTNDYDAIKACHLAANAANVPIVNYGGTYYATGAAIPVATDVYNYGVTFIVGNSNLKDNPLFLMSHDSEASASGVVLNTVFTNQHTVAASYKNKCFIIKTRVGLGDNVDTGVQGEVIEEPIIATDSRSYLFMDSYDTVKNWTVDITHITDIAEQGYIWSGGIIRQYDPTTYGICFLAVNRNNSTVRDLEIMVENALSENQIISAFTANNLTVDNIKTFAETDGQTWGNYSISVNYSANVLIRNVKSSAKRTGSSTITTRCIKNYTLRDSVTRTYDVHWNAYGLMIAEGCIFSDSAHVGYGNGKFIVSNCIIDAYVGGRIDFIPTFRGEYVISDCAIGDGIYWRMPLTYDTTRDMTYFATIKVPTFRVYRTKMSRVWSQISQEVGSHLSGRVYFYFYDMALPSLSNPYNNNNFFMVGTAITDRFTSYSTWKSLNLARLNSDVGRSPDTPTVNSDLSLTVDSPVANFFERNGVYVLHYSALVTGTIPINTAFLTINSLYAPNGARYFVALLGSTAVHGYITNTGEIMFNQTVTLSAERVTLMVVYSA